MRVINHSTEAGEVRIRAFDGTGADYGVVTFSLDARETFHFNSKDLESGNPGKALSGGTGAGTAENWRLELSSDLDIEALSYIRTTDGFLTSIHDVVPQGTSGYRVVTFNPASNSKQVSRLHLNNPRPEDALVTISGVDDAGESPGRAVETIVPAGEARTIRSVDLESGADGLQGALGDGTGKWRLSLQSSHPIVVMSLLASPTGHLTNLSTAPSSPPPNLITNGSFESGVSGWLLWGGADVVGSEASDGSFALRVTEHNGAEQLITGLKPNTRYTLTGSGTVAGTNALAVGVKQHGGNQKEIQFAGDYFETKSLTFTTGFASTCAKVYVYKAAGGEAGHADNITLTQGSGSDYLLTWSDEFDGGGGLDSSKWKYENGFVRNEELQWYQSDNVSQSDGNLVIEAREQTFANPTFVEGSTDWRTSRHFVNYTSSGIKTQNLAQWRYSRIVVRAKVTNSTGTWPAIWTLGVSCDWPSNGEVDIMENYGGNIFANFAWGTDMPWSPTWDSTSRSVGSLGTNWTDQFHLWEMDWDEHRMSIYMDGVLLNDRPLDASLLGDQSSVVPTNGKAACAGHNPFKQSHYLLINLALGGSHGGGVQDLTFPTSFLVDYVRVYSKN